MASTREYFINAIQVIDLKGSRNIPTVILYEPGSKELVGAQAIAAARHRSLLLNEDFKVDVGNYDPSAVNRSKFSCADGTSRPSAKLASDFLHQLLNDSNEWLSRHALNLNPSILLAEPLAMKTGVAEQGWLSNYRRSLERILKGKGFTKIDFLPEPFAVFQDYRYGVKHPVVADRTKHNALVLDFGGGTFDVCVVSSSKEGDISQSGRNSRPLAGDSSPIGGFHINRLIAEDLLRKHLRAPLQQSLKVARSRYHRWRSGRVDYEDLTPQHKAFFLALSSLTHRIEDAKIALSRSVTSWNLDSSSEQAVTVAMPEDPFKSDSLMVSVRYSLSDLRKLFITNLWPSLKKVIRNTLARAQEELDGAPITVVLLSGGSANIGWLPQLIRKDFGEELMDVDILKLDDFQEVVSKGLAVECARRFYSAGGDFAGTTYNRLCLLLSPDRYPAEPRRFVARTKGLPNVSDLPGVLLPSASVLREFVNTPLTWRIKMERKPRRRLDYWFLRSSFDPDNIDSLQNIEERTVHTPDAAKSRTDRDMRVQLTVAEDGTATPRFVYKSATPEYPSIHVDGRPFYLDMTFNRPEQDPSAYLGLDFGTSNSSLSYVDHRSVNIYEQRSRSERWCTLNEMRSVLPFPVTEPLGRYFGETESLAMVARECVEAILATAAYIAYSEMRTQTPQGKTKLFLGFTQRSSGPLWSFLKQCLLQMRVSEVVEPFRELVKNPSLRDFVDTGLTDLAREKHNKHDINETDTQRLVRILAHTLNRCLVEKAWLFGSFEGVRKKSFSMDYEGSFRVHHGPSPFTRCLDYAGSESFSSEGSFLVNPESGRALSLLPLMFWDRCDAHPDLELGHLFLFDRVERKDATYSYKATGASCCRDVTQQGKYSGLWQQLQPLRKSDSHTSMTVGSFIEADERN